LSRITEYFIDNYVKKFIHFTQVFVLKIAGNITSISITLVFNLINNMSVKQLKFISHKQLIVWKLWCFPKAGVEKKTSDDIMTYGLLMPNIYQMFSVKGKRFESRIALREQKIGGLYVKWTALMNRKEKMHLKVIRYALLIAMTDQHINRRVGKMQFSF
jgi:hypothetical protein